MSLPTIIYYPTTGDPIAYYLGASKNQHENAITLLTGQGYRIKSISAYDNSSIPDKPVYAVIWVQRTGVEWTSRHHMKRKAFKDEIDILNLEGYIPTQITATGPRSDAFFGGVFEKIVAPDWIAKVDLIDGEDTTNGTLEYFNTKARNDKYDLQSLSFYGTGASEEERVFTGVWLPNPNGSKWHGQQIGNSSIDAQNSITAYSSVKVVPLVIDSTDGNNYAGAFTDNYYGTVYAFTGLSIPDVLAAFTTYVGVQNLRPISIQGGGLNAGVTFSAIFAQLEEPKEKSWTEVHAIGGEYTDVHKVFKKYMKLRGIRSAVLNVRKAGVVKISSAYTWAENSYPTTLTTTIYRIASISKAFASAATYHLVNDNGFNLDIPVFAYLNINSVALPTQNKDPRIDLVTVRMCLEHTGGWDSGITFDPVFSARMIAVALGLPGRASTMDTARYMYGEPLQNQPGDSTPWTVNPGYPSTPQYYSNFGYMLLELVIEKATGMSYYDYLNLKVLTPLGINNEVFVGQTLNAIPNEGTYGSVIIGESDYDPYSTTLVPNIRGGWIQENFAATAGLVTTAAAVSQLIRNYSVFRFGGRSPVQSSRAGSLRGTTSRAMTRVDDIDYFHLFTTDQDELPITGKTIADFNTEVFDAITAANL